MLRKVRVHGVMKVKGDLRVAKVRMAIKQIRVIRAIRS